MEQRYTMRRFFRLAVLTTTFALPLYLPGRSLLGQGDALAAQQPSADGQAPVPTATLHVSTQLVTIDVIVEDKNGQPVHGLKREDFVLTEAKQPQNIRHFDEQSNAVPLRSGVKIPPMPPGVFVDYVPSPGSGPLNVLLLDSLNTPMVSQSFVRDQLREYVKKAPAGTRLAIFGLSQRLYMLQGFTADPAVLRDAVEHRLRPASSALLDDATGSGADLPSESDVIDSSDPNLAEVASNVQQFEADTQAYKQQLRIEYTIDSFNELGHFLSAYPGRKNLIWFSGAFPIDIQPNPTLSNGFANVGSYDAQMREMSAALARAQVAVYPVQAGGVEVQQELNAANSGHAYGENSQAFGNALNKEASALTSAQSTMEQLADDTGGHAFYNTNDLVSAVSKAIDAGSNYYTLAYTPTDRSFDGNYRDVHVTLAPDLAKEHYRLTYRHGYFAVNPDAPAKDGSPAAHAPALSYAELAMSHGAPAPQEILFKVHVVPASSTTENVVAPNNALDPNHPMAPPFLRYVIDIAALTEAVGLEPSDNGLNTGGLDVSAYLYDSDGKLLNATGKKINLSVKSEKLLLFRHSAATAHLEISTPVKGENYLRIGVHDSVSNRMGVVEISVRAVAHLQPPVNSAAPAKVPTP